VIYPTERDVQNFVAKLPRETAEEFRLLAEAAQREYRRVRLENPGDEEKQIGVLASHAGDVFKTLAAKRLRTRSGDFASFQRAISMEGGDAETAMWFAHELYRLSGDGRMLFTWHREIDLKIWHLVRQAEDMWWLPGVAHKGWEKVIGDSTTSLPAVQEIALVADGTPQAPEEAVVPVCDGSSGVKPADESARIAPLAGVAGTGGQNNSAMVEAFLQKCLLETGVRVTRTMIWRAGGYRDRTEFERWQSRHPKATRTATQNFVRLLSMSPQEFINLLEKCDLLP
jgi:hypothetical protein